MLDKSDEIRSTIRGIMGDSVPKPRPSDVAMPSLSIDIGGINLKNHNAFEHAHPDHRISIFPRWPLRRLGSSAATASNVACCGCSARC